MLEEWGITIGFKSWEYQKPKSVWGCGDVYRDNQGCGIGDGSVGSICLHNLDSGRGTGWGHVGHFAFTLTAISACDNEEKQ